MRLLVLGRIEVAPAGGTVRPIPGRRNQQLLGAYALQVGRPVADDVVFDALWGDAWPADPGGSLRAYVTRLRRAMGDEGLLTRAPGGYSLLLDPADLDVAVFERHVAAGRAASRRGDVAEGLHELRQAEALWRGPPWTPLAGWAPADADIARCEELHASAAELTAECLVRLGRHAEAIELLTVLCERDPLRERHWELLMLALSLSGRQAEALRAYRTVRGLLVAQLGIEPSAPLRQLETDVLLQRVEDRWPGAAPDRPAAVPTRDGPGRGARGGPRLAPGLVARGPELDTLDDELERALAGEPRVAVVAGEAGIGKTKLLQAFSTRAAERGAHVDWGESYEAEATGAYRPVAALLRSTILGAGALASSVLARERGELAILLPDLLEQPEPDPEPDEPELPPLVGSGGSGGSDGPGGSARSIGHGGPTGVVGDRQLRLFDSVTRLLQAVAGDAPLVLVLDDAHWADAESLRLLAHVVRHVGDVPVLVVMAYRPEELGADHPLRAILAELRRSSRLAELDLHHLSGGEVASLMTSVVGRPLALSVTSAVATASGGNPLFVTELSKTFGPGGSSSWSLDDLEGRLPAQIEDVLLHRISLVGPPSREAFLVIAASPGGCEVPTLAEVLDRDVGSVLDAVDELLEAGLVVERQRDQDAAYAVAHALYRYAAFRRLSRARQANVHYRLALTLDVAAQNDSERHLAPAAYHWHAAGRSGDPARAAKRCEAAGDLAVERTAYADAIAQYGRALDAVGWSGGDDGVTARLRARVLAKRAEAHHRAGDPQARERDAAAAVEIAGPVGDLATLCRAALVHGGLRSTYGVANVQTTALLTRAYDAVSRSGDDGLRARVCGRLAQELYHGGDYEAARRLSAEGVDVARTLDDDEVLAAAFHGRVWTLNHPAWLDERAALADEMIERAVGSGNPEWEMAGRVWRAAALLERGDVDGLDAELEVLGRLEAVVKIPSQQVRVATLQAARAMMAGDFDRGMELAQRAHAIGVVAEPANADQVLQAQMIAPLRERGQLGAVVPLVEELARRYADAPGWRCAAAFVFCEAGQPEQGREILTALATGGFAAVPRDLAWLQAIAYLAEVAAAVGDPAHADVLYELLAPYDGRNVGLWDIASGGAVAHHLGILAVRRGDRELAERHLCDAVAFNDRTGQVPAALWSRLRLAEVVLVGGDRERAARLAGEVATRAHGRGFAALEDAAGTIAVPPGSVGAAGSVGTVGSTSTSTSARSGRVA